MSFDISRVTFDPWKDFSNVVMQQGRVQLDSDWNEWLAELTRRVRAGTLDIVGRAVYPATTPNAFLITPKGSSVTIGVGRMYVDGLLVENHGLPAPGSGGWIPPNPGAPGQQPGWDPALDELVGQNAVAYEQQPYFPGVAQQAPFPNQGGPFLVYLDVWQREVTFLEAPDLIEKAVAVDTTGRLQTVWQVKLLDVSASGNVTCATKDSDITAWNNLIQPSAGRLTTGVVQSSPSGPCCLAPNTGYTGMENQLYRVEIHEVPAAGSSAPPTFKWSCNNASVATAVTGISPDRTGLTVQSTGKDDVLRFSKNDWVEITDDWLELNGQHGELHQVSLVTDSTNTITLATPVSADTFPVNANGQTLPERHTRLVKWDQQGKVFQSDGTTVWTDLDVTGTGEIPVPPPGTALILENGVTVSFDLDPNIVPGAFKVGDYWNFAARTLDGTVENLVKAPPRGIHHHYARLSILTLSPPSATDCRIQWGEGCCDCTSCVTAQGHNSGAWTIQEAINAVQAQGGGKICLGPGVYNITTAVTISGAQNLALCGHGLPLLQPTAPVEGDTIIFMSACIDIDVSGIAFAGGLGVDNSRLAGLAIFRSSFVHVEECSFGLVTDTAPLSPAISFADTAVLFCAIRGNLFNNVAVGIGTSFTDSFLLTQLEIEDNQMFCRDGGVVLSSSTLFVSDIRFAHNFVQSASGFVLSGIGFGVSVDDNTFRIAATPSREGLSTHAAVACNISQTRVANNDISAWSVLTASPSGTQGMAAGTYFWVVTAVDAASGRERLITGLAALTLATPANAQLQWTEVGGAKSYNVYRTKVNAGTLLLDGTVQPGSGTTVSYTDTVSDAKLTNDLPNMENDGIVLAPTAGSIMFGTQVIGNQISGLMGVGISAGVEGILAETIITENQILNLGGSGIVLEGFADDLDIARNSLVLVAQFPVRGSKLSGGGIQLAFVINANLSENKIENVGSAIVGIRSFAAVILAFATEVRIAGNSIVNIAPGILSGIFGLLVAGRLDVGGNVVRRASTPPAQPDQTQWLAFFAVGQTVSVQGNLLESFGGSSESQSPGAVQITAQQCVFSNNQCFLDDPSGANSPILVVAINSTQSTIAMGNRVQGPTGGSLASSPPSMALTVPVVGNIPSVTVIGNITSSRISVNNGPVPTPMAPLNVIA